MKAISGFSLLFILFFIGTSIQPNRASAQNVSVSFQLFYDDLSPYGNWIDNPEYGYVWVPDVAPGFEPYATNGYWILTDDGWAWYSNYPWGWAPFHYGRWYNDSFYGPIWVPDNEWSPGWVIWRRSPGYYGWAPMSPGISYGTAYGNDYNVPNDRWTYVGNHHFGHRDIDRYYVNSGNKVTIINNSTVINNTRVNKTRNSTYNGGPDRSEVEKSFGRKITPVAIRDNNKPGQNLNKSQLQIYRPEIQKPGNNGQRPVPAKITPLKDVKRPDQRTGGNLQPKVKSPANQPVKQQVRKQQPSNQPAKQQIQRQQPAKQPAKQQMQRQQPAKQPAKQQMQRQPPAKQPVKQQMQKQQPNNQPARQQIQKQQPVNQQAKQQQQQPQRQQQQQQQQQHPQRQQPAKQQPEMRQPANQQPVQQQPQPPQDRPDKKSW